MRVIDISMPIHRDMPVYRGRAEKRPTHHLDKQMPYDSINETSIKMNLHTGTHLDSPRHMMADGWTMEDMPLHKLITKCKLFDLTQVQDAVTKDDLVNLSIEKDDFILLKTQNSFGRVGDANFVYIRQDAAEYLAQIGIKGIGTDALGVERDQPGHPTHLAFLKKDIIILEGLALANAPEGSFTLIALPILIKNAEGSPARAVLIDNLSNSI
ncbi:MAG: cyclase family protein [Clostridiales bacterium]|nr:cyclase family protein [Clostridiales bacterium]